MSAVLWLQKHFWACFGHPKPLGGTMQFAWDNALYDSYWDPQGFKCRKFFQGRGGGYCLGREHLCTTDVNVAGQGVLDRIRVSGDGECIIL